MTSRNGSTIRRAALVLIVVGLAVVGWTGFRIWRAWAGIERVAFDPKAAAIAIGEGKGSPDTSLPDDEEPSEPLPEAGVSASGDQFAVAAAKTADEAMDVYLIIGSDERYEGASRRADVILLFVAPTDGSGTLLVSIPRDLYLRNPCTGKMNRINVNLNGCGSAANGPEQVAIAVGEYTGIEVDHFIVFDFDGFRAVVDRVGGVEVCTPYAVRDANTSPVALDLPAGCSNANGHQALAWVRSRHTEGFIDGSWRPLAVSDLTRNQRQQEIILQALESLGDFGDISELTALVESVSDAFAVDEGLGLGDAIAFAWSLRGMDPATITRPVIPVANWIDPTGRWVLVPQATFEEVVVAARPDLAGYFEG